jgi:hypothetical protein
MYYLLHLSVVNFCDDGMRILHPVLVGLCPSVGIPNTVYNQGERTAFFYWTELIRCVCVFVCPEDENRLSFQKIMFSPEY